MMTPEQIATALREARRALGLTQAQAAALAGMPQPNWARLEAAGGREERSPSVATLTKAAAAVGLTLELRPTLKKSTRRTKKRTEEALR